ncbi:Rossmann fold domain-containing protein [Tsuneonella sp. HG094]
MRIGPLPERPLEASAAFHAECLPRIVESLAQGDDLVLAFDPTDHTHRAWRLAAVQGLAREYAPKRINAVASVDDAAIAAAEAYIAAASGVTGQYWALDGSGAGNALG